MTIDYRNSQHVSPPPKPAWRAVVGWIVGGMLLIIVLWSLLLPSMGRARETAKRVMCASCLRQIGQAATYYASDHGGHLPPDLVTLFKHGDITTEVFTCPSSDIERAHGADESEMVADFLAGDHLSYAWAGNGLTSDAPSDVILAFDLELHVPRDNAKTTGVNVLFADGSVTFVDETAAKAIQAQFFSGVRPIRLPAPAPATTSTAPAPRQ